MSSSQAKKQIAKNILKIKKTPFRHFFQAKTGWDRPRRSENKNYRFDHFLPDS